MLSTKLDHVKSRSSLYALLSVADQLTQQNSVIRTEKKTMT